MRAYLITDHPDDEAFLGQALRLAGFRLRTTENMQAVIRKWPDAPANLIVAALRKPTPSAVVHGLRPLSDVPLLLVLAPLPEDEEIALLDSGADWIIARPYNIRLLTAYLRVLYRQGRNTSLPARAQIELHDVTLDGATRTVTVADKQPQRLSQLEYRLLHALMSNHGQVLPPESIVEYVWGYTGEGDRSLVRGLINRLRAKIELDPHSPQYILTVPGVGYSFGEPSPQ